MLLSDGLVHVAPLVPAQIVETLPPTGSAESQPNDSPLPPHTCTRLSASRATASPRTCVMTLGESAARRGRVGGMAAEAFDDGDGDVAE